MDPRETQQALRTLGWPIAIDGAVGPKTREAIGDFQLGFGFRDLAVDGVVGPDTEAALREALARGGACATFFRFAEFASKGNRWIKVHRALVRRLDRYRERVGPVLIISGYRDPARNTAVGGARNSQHLFGTAADVPGVLNVDQAKELGFSGIGFRAVDGRVVHLDVRAEGPNNTTGSAPGRPAVWRYG